ncbi:MAG: hypothetical protein M3312_00570 [Actinomycetota bacterium]|nr:hypothetical protein [Actinomycetota bacterium]
MTSEDTRAAAEALAVEEADAWFEYLAAVRECNGAGRYEDVESWAWARLVQRLRRLELQRFPRAAA